MPNENLHENTEQLSDFDKAWAEIEGTPSSPSEKESHTEESEKTSAEETAPEAGASEANQETSKEEGASKSAETENVDQFAGWTEEQKSLYLKTERDGKASVGRLRVEQQRNLTLEQQLEEARQENIRLAAEARKPTEFELAHPEYAEDIKTLVGAQSTEEAQQINPVDLVLAAHPDAADLLDSTEYQAWLADQDEAVLVAANGTDVRSAIGVLTDFKSFQSTQAQTQKEASLAAIADVGGTQGQPDLRSTSQLSQQERYDLAWSEFED